uniref:hypothetical protein n=1 Tax=Desulfosarcina sp. TaxID=2027861 RepID=UPI0035672035
NKPDHPHFRGRYAVVADFDWDPSSSAEKGYRIFAYLHELVTKNFGIRVSDPAAKGEYNFMVTFASETTDAESEGPIPQPGQEALGGNDAPAPPPLCERTCRGAHFDGRTFFKWRRHIGDLRFDPRHCRRALLEACFVQRQLYWKARFGTRDRQGVSSGPSRNVQGEMGI